MASFLQSYETEKKLRNSLKKVISRKAQDARIQKAARKPRIESLWI